MIQVVIFGISFIASIVGAICGIGGGVIIKPVLDSIGVLSVSAISFLSGCTVLVMSAYSVIKERSSRDKKALNYKNLIPLALGAAIGGIIGKILFQYVSSLFVDRNTVGAVQAAILLMITIGALAYTIYKDKIKTLNCSGNLICTIIGFTLGVISSFLGIGGGPINLVVLYFFFSMNTKDAAISSLFVILFSQIFNLVATFIGKGIPDVSILYILGMSLMGILGGMCGRTINKNINDKKVELLFKILMIIIIFINIYNIVKYS